MATPAIIIVNPNFVVQFDLPIIYRGMNWGPFQFALNNSDGTVVDLSAATPVCGNKLFTFTLAFVTDGKNGQFTLALVLAQTSLIPIGKYPYDMTGVTGTPMYSQPFFGGYATVKQPPSISI